MRYDRRRTRGVALVLAAIAVVAAGAGGGLAVADVAGPPAETGGPSFQSDDATEDADDGESTGDTETATETEPADTPTAEPDDASESDSDDAAADDEATEEATATSTETATATETPTATDTPTATETETPASTEAAAVEETATPDGATGDDANVTETGNASGQANATTGVNDTGTPNESTDDGSLTSCTVVDEPGQYELTGDVSGSGTCLVVEASDVVLDGNGHTVAGSGSGTGIQVAGGVSGVTVRNVDVSDWGVAVALGGSGASGPTANLVEVRATDSDTGVRLTEADGSAMQAVTASGNGDGVVLVDTADVQASDVTVDGNDGTGLWLARGVSDSSFSIVQATDNGDRGIHVATGAADNFVGDATVTDNGGPGVEFADSSNNVLADSRVERNGGPGVLSYPAGGDRLENVQLADNGDGAYRDQAERAGAVADTVTLSDGASVRFDQGVTRLASAGTPDSLPDGTESAGPAVEVALRDGATATVTVPVDADGDVTAYQRVDGNWQELEGTTVSDGEAEIPVSQSGTVVPVVENAGDEATESTPDDGTETAPGDDTVRADTSSNEELVATDGGAASDGAASSEPATGDTSAASAEPAASDDAAASANTAATNDAVPASRYAFDADRFADVSARSTAQYENRTRTLVIGPAAVDDAIEYSFDVDGNVSKIGTGNVTAEANDSVSRTNGTVTVDGTTSAGDAYAIDGELTAIRQAGGSTGFFVRYDGPIGANDTQP